VEYAAHDWLLAAEYGRWHSKRDSTATAPMLAAQPWVANERYYAMAAYRPGPRLQVGSYYAGYFPDARKRSGRENQLHDFAGTIRVDITQNWLIKLEGHFMKGTAGLNRAINDRDAVFLSSRWALFMLKTTAYF